MSIDLLYYPDKRLREKSMQVRAFGPQIAMMINSMYEVMNKYNGVGLAAPQVGIMLNVFVAKVEEQKKVFINPHIIKTSVEEVEMQEGCLSMPGIFAYVKRPESVTIQFQDQEGKFSSFVLDDIWARVFQHENDHLHGILFIDHVSQEEQKKLLEEYSREKAQL